MPGGAVGLTGSGGLIVQDCQGTAPLFGGSSAAVLQLPSDGRSRYLQSPVGSSTIADYLSDTCEGATPFQLPADFLGAGQSVLQVIVEQMTAAPVTVYLQIQVPSATAVTTYGVADEICGSCAFDQGPCQPQGPATGALVGPQGSPVAPGPLYLKLTLPSIASGSFLPAEVADWITFQN